MYDIMKTKASALLKDMEKTEAITDSNRIQMNIGY